MVVGVSSDGFSGNTMYQVGESSGGASTSVPAIANLGTI